MGLEIQVEIQCLRVVSGVLRLNRRRPATIRTLSVIVRNTDDRGQKTLLFPTYTQGGELKEKTLADIVSDRLRCNRGRSEANPTIFRQNRVKILEKISDNVTAPLLLGLLLGLFKDSLFSTTTPGQN